jgi:diacylglycerol kinase family enzyme
VSARRTAAGRVAALIALIAAAGVVATLVLLVFRNAFALLALAAAVVVAGAAGWVALTRHGAVRVLGLVTALAAVAGGTVVMIRLGAIDELLAFAGATAVFVAASRSALRAERRARGAAPPAPRRARRPVLLMNPKSGGGKVERFHLVDEARRRGITPVVLGPGDDLEALAREAVHSADVVGMAGGDGSQALVAGVAAEHDVAYVCVPAGTRNHLALDLGLDRDDVVGALDAFTAGVERRIDLAFVNDRIFVNNVSLGVYAQIVASDAYRDAKLRTMERMLPELLGPNAARFDLRFDGPGHDEQQSAALLLVSNNRYVLDRLTALGSRPRLDGGELGILAVSVDDAAAATQLLSLEAVGQVRRYSGWVEWTAPEMEVRSSSPVATGIDGEAVVLEPPLRFRTSPGALRVRLPAAAAGLSPAALTPGLSRTSVRELGRIAIGR